MNPIDDASGKSRSDFVLDYTTPTDPGLQAELERIDARVRSRYGMEPEHAAAGLLDLRALRPAMIHPDRMEYAASLPKVGILLAWFEKRGRAPVDPEPEIRRALGLMIKASSNGEAARFSRELGLREIQAVLDRYGFYDASRGGGLWVGKHYGLDGERYGDPLADHSHGATVRQLLRFYLLLEQGKLVSPEASRTMREIFSSPGITHDPIKFVRALAGRDVRLLRKWGTWRDWRHDSARVEGPGRRYVLVGLTRHPAGDAYLEDLALAVDTWLAREG